MIYITTSKSWKMPIVLKIISIFLISVLSWKDGSSQVDNFKYLGQSEPSEIPKVFFLPLNEWAMADRIAISSDYKEIYFTEFYGPENNYTPSIKYYEYDGILWHGPKSFCDKCECPLLSPDDKRLFLNEVYYSRTETGWSDPEKFINYDNTLHYLQQTNSGTYYFLSFVNDSITDVFEVKIKGQDTITEPLGFNMKSTVLNDYFMDPDENFVLVSLNNQEIETYGGKDIFIRYKTDTGWTHPINLGRQINTENVMTRYGMCLSPDKRNMFYTQIDEGKVRIFWVRVDELFDELKKQHTKMSNK